MPLCAVPLCLSSILGSGSPIQAAAQGVTLQVGLQLLCRLSLYNVPLRFGERSRGNAIRGNRKSASERVSEREGFQRFSEVFRGFQRFSEVFRGFQRFSEVLSETLSDADFPLRGSVAP